MHGFNVFSDPHEGEKPLIPVDTPFFPSFRPSSEEREPEISLKDSTLDN